MNPKDLSFYDTAKYKLVLSLALSLFFYVFIVFFLPFGVDNYDPNHAYNLQFFLEIFYFFSGLLAFCLLSEFVLRPLFVKTASPRRIITWSIWTLCGASAVIFLIYNYLGNWHDFNFTSFLEFIINVSAVLIFPLAGVFFFFKYRVLQTRITDTEKEPPKDISRDILITFKGSGTRDEITLASSCFLYGKAQDNYVELFYVEENAPKKFVMRATLTGLIKSLQTTAICRCHRSYMVNLTHVKAIKGQKGDTILLLAPFDTPIPVSKSYLEDTSERLKNIGS